MNAPDRKKTAGGKDDGPWLSIVIPVYNEEANLPELLQRCLAVGDNLGRRYEIVLVDDGSRDASEQIIRAAVKDHDDKIAGVFLNRNYGQHAAVMAGLAHASGAVIVTLDADLQNPPEEIPRLLVPIEDGCDVVGSVRMDRKDSLFRRLSSRIINKAVQRATGVMMTDYGCMLRAYSRQIVNAMLQCREHSTFIPVLANSFANRTAEIEVSHAERSNDESKYDIWKLINLQFDLLTSMTTFPLRLLSILGGGLALLGFMFSLLLFVMRFAYGAEWAAEGVFTVFAILFIFIGLQLLAIGVVGEYIGRIYNDVRDRPSYFIREVIGTGASRATDKMLDSKTTGVMAD
ncbi:MAG: glycosyltransferase [Gammaproteobacteria bacterium]|jgi:undecaprenyl-phosphate 4-deoxy-4-formamido-L-arabinose transferase|nr:glycosyltransferase [Gammaproteobacteria bacterium]